VPGLKLAAETGAWWRLVFDVAAAFSKKVPGREQRDFQSLCPAAWDVLAAEQVLEFEPARSARLGDRSRRRKLSVGIACSSSNYFGRIMSERSTGSSSKDIVAARFFASKLVAENSAVLRGALHTAGFPKV